jgi:hypothetical protein
MSEIGALNRLGGVPLPDIGRFRTLDMSFLRPFSPNSSLLQWARRSPWLPAVGRSLVLIGLPVLLLVTACGSPTATAPDSAPASPTEQVAPEQPTAQPAPSVPDEIAAAKPKAGDDFNRFFPQPEGDFDRVFSQEKEGFAEAKLKRDGEDVAMLSINDLVTNPSALQKYQDSESEIAGYPASIRGKQTAVLVGDRYQVKVQSRDDSFMASDRAQWIGKFDLPGLANLK